MCDTILATPAASADGQMLFGKNSDRQRNEAQLVEWLPAADHPPDAMVSCTYIAIPQARRTRAVLICRPFWTWGAEMGANAHGVVIGNEGLQARMAPPISPALTGLDLVRLALERASSAEEAVNVITTLLESYGQGGDCGHLTPSWYNNGFVVADDRQAFVIETVGRTWLVERCIGTRSLSNGYSIATPSLASSDLDELTRSQGWSPGKEGYAAAIGDPDREHLGNARARRSRSSDLLARRVGRIDARAMMQVLRDHGRGDACAWRPSRSERSLCMHAGGHDKPGQTVGTLVSDLQADGAVHWVTATAAPCLSVFKPVLLDVGLPTHGPAPSDRADDASLWWRHEAFHRAVLAGGLPEFLAEILAERDQLESRFAARMADVVSGGDRSERAAAVAECWAEADRLLARWVSRLPASNWPEPEAFHDAWITMDRIAGRARWPLAANLVGRGATGCA